MNDFVIPDRRGLVGEWLLNGSSVDTSGNGYNGTASNVTYSIADRGYQTYAGNFNGSSSKFSGFSGDITVGTTFTAIAWFNCASLPTTGNTQAIFGDYKSPGFPSYGDGGFYLQIQNNSGTVNLRGTVTNSTTEGTEIVGGSVSANTWYMGVLTYDGANERIYLNGTQVSSRALTGDFGTSTAANNRRRIGMLDYSLEIQWFNGKIQGCRAIQRALSETEIRNWYLEGMRALGGSTLAGLMDGVVAYYDMRGDADDIIGGNDGTVSGATLTTDSIGNTNSAYLFNRAASNYISCTSSSGVTGTKLTVEFSINAVTYASPYRYVGEDTTVGTRGWEVAGGGSTGTNARIFFSLNGTENLQSSTDLVADTWHHVVCTFDGSTKTIYVDGISDGSQAYSGSLNAAVNPLQFGRNVNGTSYSYLDGKIGFVRVFNVVKTSDQVKLLSQLSAKEKLLTFV